jgi:hypothetical protein
MMFLNWECPAISLFLDRSFFVVGSGVAGMLLLDSGRWMLGRRIARLSARFAQPRQRSEKI